jgi:hypothetical protein
LNLRVKGWRDQVVPSGGDDDGGDGGGGSFGDLCVLE